MPAHARSKLLAETATKDDVLEMHRDLARKIDSMEARLQAEIVRGASELRSDFSRSIAQTSYHPGGSIGQTGAGLSASIAQSRAHLAQVMADGRTQRMRLGIAMIIIMSIVFTLLEIFI